MSAYVIRRLLWIVPVLWAVATITFFLMHAIPGGPFSSEKDVPPVQLEALNRRYNLDEPLWNQYILFLWNALRLDLGISYSQGDREVTEILADGLFVSAQLGILAILLAIVVGMILGTLSALNQNGILDYVGVAFATIGASVPHFVLATFLVIFFAINLGWFKIVGWGGPEDTSQLLELGAYEWNKMVIPVVALGALPAAFIARVTRASILEVLSQDYIRTARAKGLTETRVVMRHTIKNALIPVLTIAGPLAADLMAGSFIIETMFVIPGLGREFVDSVIRRDYALIMGSTLLFAFIVTMANLLVDLAYAVVDPRIRYR